MDGIVTKPQAMYLLQGIDCLRIFAFEIALA